MDYRFGKRQLRAFDANLAGYLSRLRRLINDFWLGPVKCLVLPVDATQARNVSTIEPSFWMDKLRRAT
jgi:hypothetical protein